ncbi:MAG TPA: deoxyribose-phosphate aldolase [Holophagaceae bacterium]|jgi:deoxyribose-phosphate aldolase|nr:deoxyribose-phosphate aldolase [Holophagaceae bacterium]
MSMLEDLAREALARLEARPFPSAGASPQLLACAGGRGLIRDAQGVREIELTPGEAAPRFDLAPLLDHTLLKAEATADHVERLCDEAADFGFASVCVNPAWVASAAARLRRTEVRVCTVAGFPLGATTAGQKAFEAASALEDGASEVDMALPIGAVLAGDWAAVAAELALLRKAVPQGRAILKVILETCLLDEVQKVQACRLVRDAGADFVKTSTGFGAGGATEADVALLRRSVGAACGVKASGGIRSYGEALRMVRAGATRLGLSASIAVALGAGSSTSGY